MKSSFLCDTFSTFSIKIIGAKEDRIGLQFMAISVIQLNAFVSTWMLIKDTYSVYTRLSILMDLRILFVTLIEQNMTLRKKRIIGGKTSQAFYSSILISGIYIFIIQRFIAEPPKGMFDPRLEFVHLALASYISRRYLSLSRFASWTFGLLAMETLSKVFGAFA